MARQMKNSGIAWIGEIPREWESKRLKYLVTYNDEVLDEKTDDSFEFNYIDIGSVEYGKGITQFQHMRYADAPSRARRIVKKDDVILSTVRTYLKAVATISASDEPQIASTGFAVLRARENEICPAFLNYAVLSDAFISTVEARSVGISYPAINASDVVTIAIPIPKLPEQRRIADFLDTECARIDAVIEQTRASIEEYKKLKQSVITEAVTKGIRPGRKMKDSGIEWIGEIPEEWDVVKTMRILAMPITDGPHTTPELLDSGVAFVSAEAVSCGNGKIDFSHIRGYISEAFYQECCLKYVPAIDDVYMIKSGATTGKVAIVDTLEPKFTIWSPLAVFRCNSQKMIPKYLFYELQSDGFQKQVEFGWSFGTQQNIGMRVLEQLKVSLPPIAEQQEIAAYLDEKCVRVESLIIEKQRILSELESYKKSLIFEYVTGKKEVPVA